MHIRTNSFIEWSIFMHGSYEPEIEATIRTRVKEGMTCLDIGANVGVNTLLLAFACGSTGKVLAFEPRDDLFRRLQANCKLNVLTNVTANCFAVSESSGKVSFFTEDSSHCNKGGGSLVAMPIHGITEKITIQKHNAAEEPVLTELKACDFIKIDTEGHDAIVLRSLRGLIEKFRPTVVLEYSPEHWMSHQSQFEDVPKILKPGTYKLHAIPHLEREITYSIRPQGGFNILAIPRT